MRILMIVPYFSPDLGPSAPLFTMLSTDLARHGHRVIVIATVPHYPSGTVVKEYRKKWIQRSIEDGVEVIRVRIPSLDRSSLSKRMLQFITYQLGATLAGLRETYDVAFVANPALWVWLPFVFLVKARHTPCVFSVQDVYPDIGVSLGIFKHKPIIDAVAALERICLSNSTKIQIISDSFKPGLRKLGVQDEKLVLINNWVDTDLIQPFPRENTFTREQNFYGQFIVLYAGNIGLSQGLENVLGAAEILTDTRDIRFVFIGDGAAREGLLRSAEKKQLNNVQFISFQPRERLPEVLAAADVSLVVLRRDAGSGSMPSKVLSILASGRPILASVDDSCEVCGLVERARAGICVPPDNPMELARAIILLKQDRVLREEMGKNGRGWVEKYHSRNYAITQYERLFQEIYTDKMGLRK